MTLLPMVNKNTPFGWSNFRISTIRYFITKIVLMSFKAPVVEPAEPPRNRKKKITVFENPGHDSKFSVPYPVVVISDTVVKSE